MRKIWIALCLSLLCVTPSVAAFTSNVIVLEKAEITKLVELEATRTFHLTAGFSTKQYDEFRSFLKYRLQLLMEIHARNIEIPVQMER